MSSSPTRLPPLLVQVFSNFFYLIGLHQRVNAAVPVFLINRCCTTVTVEDLAVTNADGMTLRWVLWRSNSEKELGSSATGPHHCTATATTVHSLDLVSIDTEPFQWDVESPSPRSTSLANARKGPLVSSELPAIFFPDALKVFRCCTNGANQVVDRMQHTLLPPLLLDEFITNPGDPPEERNRLAAVSLNSPSADRVTGLLLWSQLVLLEHLRDMVSG